MIRICQNCGSEDEFRSGFCSECGEEYKPQAKVEKVDEWAEETEWNETDWGQDIRVKGGDN